MIRSSICSWYLAIADSDDLTERQSNTDVTQNPHCQSAVQYSNARHCFRFISSYTPLPALIKPLINTCTIDVQLTRINVQTVRIPCPCRTNNSNILRHDIATSRCTTTRKRAGLRRILLARLPLEVLEHHVANRQRAGVFEAKCQIRLAVALIDFNRIVDVVN